ncbi:MAG: siphovirus ReqiPepy6 Gp37-like family protein [Eubacteriales bacterium]|jgi:hypothetical protein
MLLWILDLNLEKIGIVSKFESLQFNTVFNGNGDFTLTYNANSTGANYIQEGRIVYLDAKRVGLIDYVGIARKTDKQGERAYARGRELKDIINDRITIPPAASTSGYDTYRNKNTDYIALELLTKHITNPENADRKIPFFELAPYQAYGSPVTFSTRYKNLGDEISALLSVDELGLTCSVNIDTQKATLGIVKPTDRSIGQTANPRAIFSLALGTLSDTDRTLDARAYKNYAYTAGQGEGAARVIDQLYTTSLPPTGAARRELFVDARDIQDADELPSRGLKKLAELDKLVTIDGGSRDIGSMTYALGDLCTIIDVDGTATTKQIVGIEYLYRQKTEEKRLIFGSRDMTISQAIKQKFQDINNELTR